MWEDDGAAHGRRPRGDHRGEVVIGGRVVNDLEPKERDVAMVFQNYALYPHMTVRDNIAFPLKMQKVPKSEIDARVAEAARLLGLERAAPPQAARALGRPAPAGRHGPGDRPAPAGVPDGRAALEPRREAARPDAGRARQAAPPARRDHAVRDARPDRGDDARPAGRGAAPGASSSRSTRRSASTTARRTRSSRASSARRR